MYDTKAQSSQLGPNAGDTAMYALPAKSVSSLSQASSRTVNSERKVRIRYGLMGVHFAFILTTLIQSYVQGNNALSLLVHAIGLAAFLIYVPAAMALCWKRKRCSFDHAGGEVAYAVVQGVIWALSAATSFLAILQSSCTQLIPAPPSSSVESGADMGSNPVIPSDPSYPSADSPSYAAALPNAAEVSPQTQWRCGKYLITAILSLVHVALLIGWTVWIVLEVSRRGRGGGRGFKVPVGEVLRGGA